MMDVILQRYVTNPSDTPGKLLGAAFIVLNGKGDTLYANTAGKLNFDQDSPPYTEDSFSWIASLTKLVTAVAVMQLVEGGRIGLDDDLRPRIQEVGDLKVLEGFEGDQPVLVETTNPITLRTLLTHTSGLCYDLMHPDDIMKWAAITGRKDTSLTWSLEGLTAPLKFQPGEGWMYGSSMDFAGLVIERLTNMTLGEYMQEHIFNPLRMSSTTFRPSTRPDLAVQTMAWAYRSPDTQCLPPGPPATPRSHPMESGGAGLFSTPKDYTRFLKAVMCHEIINAESTDELFRPQLTDQQRQSFKEVADNDLFVGDFPRGIEMNHGLGGCLNMEDIGGKRKGGSLMWTGMTNGHWWIDRTSGIAAVMVTSLMPPGDLVATKLTDELEREVYREFVGVKES